MKTIFHLNKKIILLVAFLSVIFIFRDFIINSVVSLSQPILKAKNSVMGWFDGIGGKTPELSLTPELEAKILSCEILEKQNEELKTLLSRAGKEKYIAAAILSRPPQSPYDVLIIDVGSEDGIEKGMRALAYGDILLGYVSEIFPKISKVKLISHPGEETNVFIVDSNVSAIAVGRGGENLEITLPRSIEINSGAKIIAPGMDPLAVGIVEEAQIDLAASFQRILFRLPVNIRELKYVMIKI